MYKRSTPLILRRVIRRIKGRYGACFAKADSGGILKIFFALLRSAFGWASLNKKADKKHGRCRLSGQMDFPSPLIEGLLVRRYQRFLADVALSDGRMITAHTPNTGSMKGCSKPGSRVWLRDTGNFRRKYILTWELVEAGPGVLVGINTGLPSRLVAEGIRKGVIAELQGYDEFRSEVPYGRENSRIDLLLKTQGEVCCYVEVKNVTLVEGRTALFPDAVSVRGTKHLRELAAVAEAGHRAVIFFCVQRADAVEVRPADAIDPRYGQTLRQALACGVEALAYDTCISPRAVALRAPLPVVCP